MATVWTAGVIAALLVVAGLMFWLGSAALARHRATAAADLAALAAAGSATQGVAACDRARWVTDRMAVRLVACRFERWDALVEVEADLPGVLGRFGRATARARAGPVDR